MPGGLSPEDLDERCGRHICFRDLVEAGETWERMRLPNLPEQAGTVQAMRRLASAVLDPVVVEFGPVLITYAYAFASPALVRHVPGRIDPSLDQHAGQPLFGVRP
jgi:hypothetical protein